MKYQIVVDSSADILENEYSDSEIKVRTVPLTINVDDKEYYDAEDLDVKELLNAVHKSKNKSTTACPSPDVFENVFLEADYTFCITISSKLSGTYNSANLAKRLAEEKGCHVHVFDSQAVSGVMRLMVEDIMVLLNAGKSYDEICKLIDSENYHLLFILSNFDNLIKNGRMNKFTGILASLLIIKPLFVASDGEIKLLKKIRTLTKSLDALVSEMKVCEEKLEKGEVIISHCESEDVALKLEKNILKTYPNLKVRVIAMRGLTSFYASEKGIIVSFKE